MVLNKIQTIKEIEDLSSQLDGIDEREIIKSELIRLEEDLKYIKKYFESNYYVSTEKEDSKYKLVISNNKQIFNDLRKTPSYISEDDQQEEYSYNG